MNAYDLVVIGAGPAGALAAIRAAELGARTAIVTAQEFGGMAANDGPVPVRALAYAARLIHDARQLPRYGITVGEPAVQFDRLLARVREVVHGVSTHSVLREKTDALGVTIYEHAGAAHFSGPHTIQTESGLRLEAAKFILCTGGVSRRPAIPGIELTHTHSQAWTPGSRCSRRRANGSMSDWSRCASISKNPSRHFRHIERKLASSPPQTPQWAGMSNNSMLQRSA
jgi:pyruvate/2-oxoglutarate dehydrogenase complex dihydrolipoamide dehydrogenase (E3) component